MSDRAAPHRDAADRHAAAAQNHDRAAAFWEERGDVARAALQREMAEYERLGGELERRWAALTDADAHEQRARAAELVRRHTRRGARQVAASLGQLAQTLERSARLAEEHAERLEQAGRGGGADERKAASDARELAQRARLQAEEWLKPIAGEPDAGRPPAGGAASA